jgi:hypothetical protein
LGIYHEDPVFGLERIADRWPENFSPIFRSTENGNYGITRR